MNSLTAVIRCKPGTVDAVLAALIAVGHYAKACEPGTLGYVVIRATDDPAVLITQERFKDPAAMKVHNEGAGSATFFAAAKDMLENVDLHVGEEVFTL